MINPDIELKGCNIHIVILYVLLSVFTRKWKMKENVQWNLIKSVILCTGSA